MKIRITIKKRNWKKAVLKRPIWLIIGIIILELALRASGSVYSYLQDNENKNTGYVTSDTKNVYRILTLGESTTGDCVGNFAWPGQLQEILNNRSREIKFKVFNEGVCGTNTAFILSRLEENLENYNPDIVIAMMGNNDNYLRIKYDDTPTVKIYLMLKGLRVYKLTQLIWSALKDRIYKYRIFKEINPEYSEEDFLRYEDSQKDVIDKKINESDNDPSYEIKRIYAALGEPIQVEDTPNEEVKSNQKDTAYLRLAEIYYRFKENEKAEEYLNKINETKIGNEARFRLATIYYTIGLSNKAKEVLEKATEWTFEEYSYYHKLAGLLIKLEEYHKAEVMVKKCLNMNPNHSKAYVQLGEVYLHLEKRTNAEEMFKKAIELHPENLDIYYDIVRIYSNEGEYNKAEEFIKKTKSQFKVARPNLDITGYHYRKLYEIISSRGIRLIAMQYPTLDIEEVKQMLSNNTDIIFISNEDNFKEALNHGEYKDYFTDRFSVGGFGHATEKGNKLIAESVANVILKELGVKA